VSNIIRVNFQVVANEEDLDEMDNILDNIIEAAQKECDDSQSPYVKNFLKEILDALIDCRVDIHETKEELDNVTGE